jgi:hypothetical protein
MEVLESSEIINFGVNDNPLKMVSSLGDGKKGKSPYQVIVFIVLRDIITSEFLKLPG